MESQRHLWQRRIQQTSAWLSLGHAHLAVAALSFCVLVGTGIAVQAGRTRQRVSKPLPKTPLSGPFVSAIIQTAAAITGLALSLAELPHHHQSWPLSAALAYLLILSIAQVVLSCRHRHITSQIYHHVNAVGLVLFAFASVQLILPLMLIHRNPSSPISTHEAGLLASLAAIPLVAFTTPRQPPNGLPASLAAAEETCCWLSYYMTYAWLTPLIWRGCRRDLVLDDLPQLPSVDAPLHLLHRLQHARRHFFHARRGWRTLCSLCALSQSHVQSAVVYGGITATVEYIAPLSLFQLLAFLEAGDTDMAVVHPLVWVALLFIGPMARSLAYQRAVFVNTRMLVTWRGVLIQEVYQATLASRHLSAAAQRETLVAYDADMIANAADVFYACTASVLSTVIAMAFLFHLLGWPSLLGVVVLLGLTPLPAVFSGRVALLHKRVMVATDARLARVTEILRAIHTIKYFAWEDVAATSLHDLRAVEQTRIWRRNITALLVAMTGDMLSLVSLLAMIVALVVLTDRPLRAPMAFTALAITETLRAQYVWLAKVAQWAAQAWESMQRLDDYLVDAAATPYHRPPTGPPAFDNAVFFLGPPTSAAPGASLTSPFSLHADGCFAEGKVNVVTGLTGSGKSSLLLSLLGETALVSGQVSCPVDVSYVPQMPWLLNGTIRENIVFYTVQSSLVDEKRYRAALDACALNSDIALLPLGDATPVGERGASLSGGQRQRVALARALYSSSSTLLLDDVFAALDAHTTSSVYARCFHRVCRADGLLAGRTVILVTHLDVAIDEADCVVSLDYGCASFSHKVPQVRLDDCLPVQKPVSLSLSLSLSSCSALSLASTHAAEFLPSDDADSPHAFAQDERRLSGRVPRSLVLQYMRFFGDWPALTLVALTALSVQLAYISITFWLSIWTSTASQASVYFFLAVHAATVLLFVFLQLLNSVNFQRGGWQAARTMHHRLVAAVLHAPLAWFDQTPTGQILNRFGVDTQSMDALLVDWLRMTIDNSVRFILRLASIASIMPIFALPAACFCSLGFVAGEMYSRAEISVKRLVSARFSPVLSHFHDTVAGLAVVRGHHGMDTVFKQLLADQVAAHMRAAEAQFNCNRWVSVRCDVCAATIAMSAGTIAYVYRSSTTTSAGLVGFSLANAIGLSQTILSLVRNLNELEVELNSFQRIRQYTQLEGEKDVGSDTPADLPIAWPAQGHVAYCNVTARYAPEGPDVLKTINFCTRPGERVAVVGRTGSGKSTLALALLRAGLHIQEPDQAQPLTGIFLDGVDISRVPLQRLRRAVTMIPQETMLFRGTVRSNVDPTGLLSDAELWRVLQRVSACTSSAGLSPESPVASEGRNFSSGQRQILGLARAMARQAKVLLIDEATASVDYDTDARMQDLMRTAFAGSTVITIAHRLRTVMDYDRVLVMAQGVVVEMGSPTELVRRRGVFWDMLQQMEDQ